MTELLTAAQMRAIEAAAIASGTVTGLELMERAGRGVVEAIFEEWPALRATSHRAVVLCGPGNNGGDGFVVARLLKEWGWEVDVFLYGDAEKLPPDAKVNYERWLGMGTTSVVQDAAELEKHTCDVVIDALFGTGLTRALSDAAEMLADWSTHNHGLFHNALTVCVDVPTGVCSDSGRRITSEGFVFRADLTVTFHRAKVGHYIDLGIDACGKIAVVDIGLIDDGSAADADAMVNPVWRAVSPNPADKEDLMKFTPAHKFTHGHALILSGGITTSGAARLAARGALRIGAGVVTLGCPPSAVMVNAGHLNAIMLKSVGDAAALAGVLEDTRINALCLGPGLGLERGELVAAALDGSRGKPRPTVLDADALTLLAGDAALFAMLHPDCVLTPHAGEFARLFPDIAAKLNEPATKGPAYSKVDATREAAKRAGCVVLFKGADTVIAGPSGRCSINAAVYDRAAPWLATAGSGDVLAGFITGLLARGFAPMTAAEMAAWLHVECARSFGPCLIAEDLPEELPKVFRALGL
ncbi:bifunctional ADP-dependent NAD(P)H-hydrate dehydratase/NAD(P)H-hydrate epimerase [Pseudorhodobacter ferrugineus]|uniref:bifunctional ADP-dependent NAD(P)H-hydrate dehydratase/NAD(P)H-hydrate epimerase n=1 Tax=Pseudorhodobacter ferrugineus TaxID=77008 RepID=UPI0003B74C91|nr:bifunctional ADP-dependent NAD(P)H-hydrate dehydratase/NAD(P)H-hydrate epimerase [Pseudorhodobacter ferrugineus]